MFSRLVLRTASLAAIAALCFPASSSAQGLLQSIFGWGAQPPPQAAQPMPPVGFGHRAPSYNPYYQRDRSGDADLEESGRGEKFRTVCVRLCDGYYWPISNATARTGFYRDANACRASCGEEVRLFLQPPGSGDAKTLVDTQGRPYTGLPNAFRHRKEVVPGCRCKPEPWSQSEMSRHERYALEQAARDPRPVQIAAPATTSATPASEPAQEPDNPGGPADPAAPAAAPAVADSNPAAGSSTSVAPTTRRAKLAHRETGGRAGQRARQPVMAIKVPRQAPQVASAPFGLGGPASQKRWPGD